MKFFVYVTLFLSVISSINGRRLLNIDEQIGSDPATWSPKTDSVPLIGSDPHTWSPKKEVSHEKEMTPIWVADISSNIDELSRKIDLFIENHKMNIHMDMNNMDMNMPKNVDKIDRVDKYKPRKLISEFNGKKKQI